MTIVKTIIGLALFVVIMFSLNSAFASCSKNKDAVVTGAACSIAELNKTQKIDLFDKQITKQSKERNLRPVKIRQEFSNIEEFGCFWGQCLIKQVFNK